jgi:hypothetical protein
MQLPLIVLKRLSIKRLFRAAAVTRLFLYKISFICHLLSVVIDSAANYLSSVGSVVEVYGIKSRNSFSCISHLFYLTTHM